MTVDRRLLWIALGGFVGANEGFLIGSLLPLIGTEFKVSVGQAGLVVFAHALAYAVGTPILSAIFGKVDRRSVLVGAELTFAFFALLMAVAPSFWWLVVARTGLALGAGLFTATAFGTAIAISPPDRRGRAIGTVASGQSLALLVGVPTAAFVAVTAGWHILYFAASAMAVLAALAFWTQLPPDIPGDPRPLSERVAVVQVPGVARTLLIMLVFMLAAYIPLIFVAPMAAHLAGFGREMLPIVLLANGAGAVAGTTSGGKLADLLGARKTVSLLCLAQVGILVSYAAIPLILPMLAAPAYLLVIAAAGFVGWAFWAAQSSLLGSIAGAAVSLALALNLTALNLGLSLAAVIGGAVIDNVGVGALAAVAIPFALIAVALTAARQLVRV